MSNPSSAAVAAAINIAALGSAEASKLRARGSSKAAHSAFAASLPAGGTTAANAAFHSSAVTDGPPLSSLPETEKGGSSKSRIRRASEGSRLIKGDSKKASAAELRCERCGKGYKHSSCLSKHLLVSPFPPLCCVRQRRGPR
jgi:hypothetical protein